jgi:Skp family chaperone for outer membrane proteins
MAWYENPNVIAALSGFLIAAVPAGVTARYAWRGKISELQIGQSERALTNLFNAHDNFIKELRSELADKSQQIRDLQSSRAQLYKDIDELHALRQSERRIYQEQIVCVENKVDEPLDKLSISERKARDCEARCDELLLRVESLEKRSSRKPPSPS